MGVDYMVYVGPYLRCKFHMEPKEVEKKGCPKCQCSNYNKFCDTCGSAIGTYKTTEVLCSANFTEILEEETDIHGILDGETDCLIGYIPEIKRETTVDAKREFGEIFSILNSNIISEEKCLLAAKYKKEIELLSEKYDSVELMWGCLSYTN